MKGGSKFYKPPYNKVKNSPYISNENKRIIKMEPPTVNPPPKQPLEKTTIATQEISMNPLYKKPFIMKEKQTFDRDYVKFDKPHDVPKITDEKPYRPYVKPENDKPYIKPERRDNVNEETEKPYRPYVKENINNTNDKPFNKTYPETRKINNESPNINEKQIERTYHKPYEKHSEHSYHKPYEKQSEHSYQKPYEKQSEHSYQKPYEKQPERSFHKPEHSFQKPYNTDAKYQSSDYNRQVRQPNISEAPVIAEQKIYQTAMTAPPIANSGHTHPKYTNPSFINLDDKLIYPPVYAPDNINYFPYMKPLDRVNEIPLQQVYNINLGNSTLHSSTLSKIYEDALPGDPYNFSMASVYERTALISFMRNSIIKRNDGEEMTVQPSDNSLLQFIRLLEFNPFVLGNNPSYATKSKGNPYASIPLNFLIYNATYPIRYNPTTQTIDIARFALGLNLRIYKLSYAAQYCENLGSNITCDNFDVRREIKYYNYIKTDIVDRKICPNFITMILYKLDKISKIDYNAIHNLIKKHIGVRTIERSHEYSSQINKLLDPSQINNNMLVFKKPKAGLATFEVNLDDDSGNSMLVLTESPNYNMVEWMCPIYKSAGAVNTMSSTGFHSPDVWRSILFQLTYAMAILQEKNIYFRDFSIENNIFIKDLFSDSNNIGHWVYKVNNIDYYIPNYGYIVLIDSRFIDPTTSYKGSLPLLPVIPGIKFKIVGKNLIPDTPTVVIPEDKQVFKIMSPIYKKNGWDNPAVVDPTHPTDRSKDDLSYYKKLILEDFRKLIDPINLGRLQRDYNIVLPDTSIMNLMNKLYFTTSTKTKIIDCLIECFPEFLHNRVGTLLTKSERDNLNPNIAPDFNTINGKLIVYQERYDEYKWGVYIGDTPGFSGKKKTIYVKNKSMDVFNHSIVYYPDAETILQTSERSYRLTKDTLIETYTFN